MKPVDRQGATKASGPRTAVLGVSMLAIAGLVGLYFAVGGLHERPEFEIPPQARGEVATLAGADLDRPNEPEPGTVDEGSPMARPDEARRAVPSAATHAAHDKHVGLLVIRDTDGRELQEEDGELLLRPGEGTEAAAKAVPMNHGRFSLEGFPFGRIRIERATASPAGDDRPIAFEQEHFEFEPDEPVILRGSYLPDASLQVLEAGTNRPINGVRVLPRAPEHAGPEQAHPGPHGPASFSISDGRSPVRLPPARGVRSYWVTAKGYGWRFILVDHETGGERVVLLEAAGRLVVEVHGDIDTYMNQSLLVDIRVYSHATGSMVTSSRLEPAGWQGFEGIAAGTYDVKVVVGPVGGSPIVLGQTQVEVTASETSTARIELTHKEALPPKGQVRGRIVLPKEYRTPTKYPSLRIQPAKGSALRQGDVLRLVTPHGPALRFRDVMNIQRDAMDGRFDEEDGREVFRWEAELSSGQYRFVVEPVQHGVLLDVPQSSDADHPIVLPDIALPDLFPVTLRVIDAKTHKPIDGATIRWSRHFAEQKADGWIEMDLESGVESATVYLTEGRFSYAASGPGYGERSMDADAGSGTSQFTLELPPWIRREIILVHGKTVVPWVQGMTCSFRSSGSKDSRPCENLGDGKMQACFEQPGVYEIVIGRLEGFREPAPVVVDVSEGDLSPVKVQLDR